MLRINSPQHPTSARFARLRRVSGRSRKGDRFKGTATVLTQGDRFEEIVRSFKVDREIDPSRVRAVVVIEVTQAQPLISPAYDSGATEEEITEEYKRRLIEVYGPF